jgi:hypothetical protein
MRRLPAALALTLVAAALPRHGLAQSGSEPSLVLSATAGVITGGSLWIIAGQPFCPTPPGSGCSGADTLRLARATDASIMIGASVSYFPSPAFGLEGDITYFGFALSNACAVTNLNPTRESTQICNDVQGSSSTSGAIALFGGVIARAAPRGSVSPYVRVGVGLTTIDQSTIDLAGADSAGAVYAVLIDESPKRVAVSALLGAGLTMPLGPGYQFRLEGKDVMSRFDRATGPADLLLRPPVAGRFFHHFALTLGFDVVLEQKRGRRY